MTVAALATEPRFVVVGTGRHGSGHIARRLTESGIHCGHEAWWNPLGERTAGLVGDSSWCAVPYLATYPGVIFHQVRDPLAVVASLVAVPDWGPFLSVRRMIVGGHAEPVEHAMAIVVAFNRAAEHHAERRWRVEDVDDDLLEEIAARVGQRAEPVEVPTDVNRHNPDLSLTWGDLPDCRARDLLAVQAERYGYL